MLSACNKSYIKRSCTVTSQVVSLNKKPLFHITSSKGYSRLNTLFDLQDLSC